MTAPDLGGSRPTILFLCVHNAGRSQMAAAFARRLGGDRVVVRSAGSDPAHELNASVVNAMAEMAIDLTAEVPRGLDDATTVEADVIVTMGCGDACPIHAGKRYVDWDVPDPAGRSVAEVRPIRDEVRSRVAALLSELGISVPPSADAAGADPAGADHGLGRPSPDLYHGTKADLRPGDLIEPGYSSNFGRGEAANFVYLTATLDAAVWGAELALGDGPGRVYVVEPTGELSDDPNLTDKKFPGNPTRSYRSRQPLRVRSEVVDWQPHSSDVLKTMKDNVERQRQLGVEAINE